MARSRWIIALALLMAPAAQAATPREVLATAAFVTRDKNVAITQVAAARAAADARLGQAPRDPEAQLMHAMAVGYTAKLKRSRADAVEAKRLFDIYAAARPTDPEAQLVVAGWHLDAINDLGSFMARTALGAKRADGVAALNRAVTLGGGRAAFSGLASLMRIRLDPTDIAPARALAEASLKGSAPTPLDRKMQQDMAQLLPPLRAGDGKAAAAVAVRLLPFGQLKN